MDGVKERGQIRRWGGVLFQVMGRFVDIGDDCITLRVGGLSQVYSMPCFNVLSNY